jgi:ubiquinone/menaquinone biosynthesis C-methylase UbiE
MLQDKKVSPNTDPSPIFAAYRGVYATALLSAAIELRVFGRLAAGPASQAQLERELGLSSRAMNVLLVALRAMRLAVTDAAGQTTLTELAREHLAGGQFDISDYVSLANDTPAVREMIERLRSNRPAGHEPQEQGVGWIYRDGMRSAMDQEAAARKLTLALAGRARNVAPVLAERVPLQDAKVLLDVGGGTGIYSIACLKRYPQLRAIIWDRPQVLKVAREIADAQGITDRLELLPGDMFADPVPAHCDIMLLSNILHDWDVPECRILVGRLAAALPKGGRLLVHDAFLNDAMDGPLNIALYSANLFCVTEGRCYSATECRAWLEEAGLKSQNAVPTLADCAIIAGMAP